MVGPLRRVGRYDLVEVIGRGGAAVVYRAYQPDLDRPVALKELAPHHAADPSFAQRFVEESRLAGSMNNAGIVTVYEYFEHAGLPYIAMEWMSRGSLRPYLPNLTGAQLGGMLESVLEGLDYAEHMGIVHRDLKPENLLVGVSGRVKIADFGIARAMSSATLRPFATVTGTPIGTPAYMAPEQATGGRLTPATDLYSLGIVAWEALAGYPPFGSSDTPMAILYRQVNEPVPPIDTIRDDIHPGASDWLARMLAKAPEDRFASAAEAWNELEDVLIDMLGPRWRRGAALGELPDDGGGPAILPDGEIGAARSVFSGAKAHGEDDEPEHSSDAGPRPQISAVLTPEPQSSGPARSSPPELDPLVNTYMPVYARHADALESADAAVAGTQRRGGRSRQVLIGAIVVVVLAAGAGAGLVIGGASSPGPPAAKAPVTTTTALGQLALKVTPVVDALSAGAASAVKSFDSAHPLKAQTAAALLVSGRYAAAEKKLKSLPAASQALPELKAVEKDLASLSTDWRDVGTDAFHNRRTQFAAEAKTIGTAQTRLATDAANATRG